MSVILYHNPRCGKSRKTLALIRAAGIEPRIVEYLDAPLSHAELLSLCSALGLPVSGLMRTGDSLYAGLALDSSGCSDEMRLDALLAHPTLFNRPVAAGPLGVRICRPPEAVLEILPATDTP